MTKDIRRYIDATVKLNESLDEGPVGWAADKLAKAGQRAASKVTFGGTKQKLKKNVDVRSDAATLIKRWNADFAARKMQRTPANVVRFLAKDKDLKMSRDDIKAAWNKTPQLTKNFGTFDEVANQLKKQPAEQPGERRDQSQQAQKAPRTGITASPEDQVGGPRESVEEAAVPATQQMSVDDLRNLLINAIHVKNASDAEKELGDFPGDDEEKSIAKVDPNAPDEQQPMPPGDAEKLKAVGAKDYDNDGQWTWKDIAADAEAKGDLEKALDAIVTQIDPSRVGLVKSVIKRQTN